MKINQLITLIICLATTAITHSAILDDIATARTTLNNAQIKITASENELKESYTAIDTGVVKKLDDLINSGIKPFITEINNLISLIITNTDLIKVTSNDPVEAFFQNLGSQIITAKTIRESICIDEILPTLGFVKDSMIPEVETTLKTVKDNFASVEEPLEPSKDSQGVYALLADAKNKFKAADDELKALHDVLAELAEDL